MAAGVIVGFASVSVIAWGAGALFVGPGLFTAGFALVTAPPSARSASATLARERATRRAAF